MSTHEPKHGAREGSLQAHVPPRQASPAPQALPHPPQLAESELMSTQPLVHEVRPGWQPQLPQAQLGEHVCEAPPPQVWVRPGEQAPSPLQIDHAPSVLSALQLRDCVPQLPQPRVSGVQHVPQSQAVLQRCWPPTPQPRVVSGAQAPCAVQTDQLASVPSGLQARVCVPQLPQACVCG
jgi:hypothetical protein